MQHAGLYPGKTQLETPVKSEWRLEYRF
jgi:hypothetical protein